MEKFIKWLNSIFIFIELMSYGLICFGLVFRLLNLDGANESFLVGFSFFAIILVLRSITPFSGRLNDNSPMMNDSISLIVRRLFYFSQAIYVFAILFAINDLSGTKEMIVLCQLTLVPLIALIGILLFKNKERLKVFQGTLIRFFGIFVLNCIIYFTF